MTVGVRLQCSGQTGRTSQQCITAMPLTLQGVDKDADNARMKEAFDTCYSKCVAQETKDVAEERQKVCALEHFVGSRKAPHACMGHANAFQPPSASISAMVSTHLVILSKMSSCLLCVAQFKKTEEDFEKMVEGQTVVEPGV